MLLSDPSLFAALSELVGDEPLLCAKIATQLPQSSRISGSGQVQEAT